MLLEEICVFKANMVVELIVPYLLAKVIPSTFGVKKKNKKQTFGV